MRPILLALCLTAPCAAMAQSPMARVEYHCADDRELQAVFINAGAESFAVIQEAGRLVPMQIARSGSGARYLSEDGRLEFWTKGAQAMLTLLGDEEIPLYRDCNEVGQAR